MQIFYCYKSKNYSEKSLKKSIFREYHKIRYEAGWQLYNPLLHKDSGTNIKSGWQKRLAVGNYSFANLPIKLEWIKVCDRLARGWQFLQFFLPTSFLDSLQSLADCAFTRLAKISLISLKNKRLATLRSGSMYDFVALKSEVPPFSYYLRNRVADGYSYITRNSDTAFLGSGNSFSIIN